MTGRRDFETDEAAYLTDVAKFCDTVLLPRGDRSDTGEFFPDIITQFAELGLLELMYDEQRNLRLDRMRLIHETTELVAAAFPASVVALGALRLQGYLLKRYAQPHIAERYLEPLLRGEIYGSFGVTEPDSGTDVRSGTTVATRDGDGWILNGHKKWIGFAPVAAFNVVLAKVDHAGRDADTVALVVDLGSEGVTRSEVLDLMSFRGMPLGELHFSDVRVPAGSALKVAGQFTTGLVLKSGSPLAWLFDNGSQARHYVTKGGKDHKTGAMWGKTPPTHIFTRTVAKGKRAVVDRIKTMMLRRGATSVAGE